MDMRIEQPDSLVLKIVLKYSDTSEPHASDSSKDNRVRAGSLVPIFNMETVTRQLPSFRNSCSKNSDD